MVATTVKSENVTIIEGTADLGLDRKVGRLKTLIDQDSVATTSIDEAGDVTLFGPIPSNAVIVDLKIMNDDLDSNACPTLSLDWGLYYSGRGGTQKLNGNTSGTVIDVDCFATAETNTQSATIVPTSIRYEADNITDVKKEAWSVAGLTSDPGGSFYIGATVETAAATAAAGDLVVIVDYI